MIDEDLRVMRQGDLEMVEKVRNRGSWWSINGNNIEFDPADVRRNE